MRPRGRYRTFGEQARPYVLITSHDPDRPLGEGAKNHHGTMLEAANAFAKSEAPFLALVYDDGRVVRDLNDRENALLAAVALKLGYEIDFV